MRKLDAMDVRGGAVGVACCVVLALSPIPITAQTSIDTFDDVTTWRTAPASGVEMRVASDAGRTGSAMKVTFDFHGGGGWAAFRRDVPVALPENYEITFWIKGDAPRNTLEFKLVDATGDNVWWVNRPEFEFRGDWRKVTFRKRHVTFAWGPKGGGDIRDVAAIEFAVTAGTGGSGAIWIDDLTVTPRDPVRPYTATPVITKSANAWTMDFTQNREYGGIVVDWTEGGRSRGYDVQLSMDGAVWQTVRSLTGGQRQRDYLSLPEAESRFLRIVSTAEAQPAPSAARASYAVDLRDVRVMPSAWGDSPNALFQTIAGESRRGSYPKYFTGVQSYWTVIGENGSPREAMMNEEGAVEVDKRSFSIEPFLRVNGKLVTWADAQVTQTLQDGYLPIPTVSWRSGAFSLRTTAWVKDSILWMKYVVSNRGNAAANASLALAIRPFQVNPLSQFLNHAGGAAPIRRISYDGARVIAADSQRVVLVTKPSAVGAMRYDQGDVVDLLRDKTRTVSSRYRATSVNDDAGFANAAMEYSLSLAVGDSQTVYIAVPFSKTRDVGTAALSAATGAASLRATATSWHALLDRFRIELPASMADLSRSLLSNVAYILINRDNAAIQPGSRSYERSWIRDGSLTSTALLRVGHEKEVRAFIEWYAPFQYADGKVPCCVDGRGADPVPENDSHGELIYLITEYFRFTGDTAFARRMWPHVERAVTYMDSLRNSRRTASYVATEFFGLLPQSISHEGYSAKPMHSYWDDSFALKGFKDAAWLAHTLRMDSSRYVTSRDEFQRDLMKSLEVAMAKRSIDFLPGAAELGDFDATSTTVALNPGGAQRDLPQAAMLRTFEKYWTDFVARRDSNRWDAYTPYEWRVVGTLVRLGQKKRALEVMSWFMEHQRPDAWNHWAEVVYRDGNAPHFIGDMPHTWVGSDFIRSALDLFVYDDDQALVLAAGVSPAWITTSKPVGVHGIRTAYGTIGYDMALRGTSVVMRFDAGAPVPPRGYVVRSPLDRPITSVTADGRTIDASGMEIALPRLPRVLILNYAK